jgi:Uma2 family endonuclease
MMAKRKPESDLPRTMAEFDAWHALRPERWEFIAGRPVMMAPASKRPTVVKTNIARHLGNKLAGKPCRTYAEGVEIKTGVLSAIPDVVVECGTIDFATPAVAEPVLIVEVLSPYTEGDDIGRKRQGHCLIQALQHYLVVAQEGRFVTLHTRTGPASFDETVYQTGVIDLPALGISISLDEIYEDVTFADSADDA